MKNLKDQVSELQENEKHMLEAIKHLNERLIEIENKEYDVKNIVESQSLIDEIIAKNSDDILFIKKTKEENTISIKALEAKIDTTDREIEQRTANLKAQPESVKDPKNDAKEKENRDITCKHYNKGFCKIKQRCLFMHISKQILIQNVKIQNVKKDILRGWRYFMLEKR